MNSRIAAVPFSLKNLKEDLEDLGSNFDGAPDLEFRHAGKALGLEQCGLCYQRIPPDYRFPYGHTHKVQEEIFVVVRGSGRMKLDEEIVEVKEWDVVRVPPGTWRGYEGGPEGLEILVFGAPHLGENPRDDVEGQRDWWADSARITTVIDISRRQSKRDCHKDPTGVYQHGIGRGVIG